MRILCVYLHTRDDVGNRHIRGDVNLSSGQCESVRTRQVLISCVSDRARCMAQVQI